MEALVNKNSLHIYLEKDKWELFFDFFNAKVNETECAIILHCLLLTCFDQERLY